ncbi:MAG: STAS domain-containing protein [Paludibacteraceae bacterium]|nr:STAS domain-containing protein [Paludibacteraceae bacterium]
MQLKFDFKDVFRPKLLDCLRNYSKKLLLQDATAGLIVGVVAIPLAIAFGISSGVGPAEGLITAIIAGFVISFFGGSKVQIGGPTGAFIIIIYSIIQQHGLLGLTLSTLMAGMLLVLMGCFKMGNIIKFVPYPVVIGFTAGIALTIFMTQINSLLGLGIENVPADFIHQIACYAQNISHIHIGSLCVGLGSILIIIFSPKLSKRIPGSLVAIVVMTLLTWLLKRFAGVEGITTISDLYQLPSGIPVPHFPQFALQEGQTWWNLIQALFPSAFTIAMLGAIESLLSAIVADGVIGDRHNSNTELIAQGLANICVPFFGGIPATGAIARTMTNINNGGKTPVAGLVHTGVLLLVLLFMGKLVGMIPMACLAGVLVMVSYNMSGWRTFLWLLKNPKSDFVVMLVTFVLTVLFNLTIAIEIGLLLAVVLFLKRTNEATVIRSFSGEIDPTSNNDVQMGDIEMLHIPEHTEVYEIDGPYFFGVANKFDEISRSVGKNGQKVRIIRMRKVSFIDSTGLHNLEQLYQRTQSCGVQLVLSGVNENVFHTLDKAGLVEVIGKKNIRNHINGALERAQEIIDEYNA